MRALQGMSLSPLTVRRVAKRTYRRDQQDEGHRANRGALAAAMPGSNNSSFDYLWRHIKSVSRAVARRRAGIAAPALTLRPVPLPRLHCQAFLLHPEL